MDTERNQSDTTAAKQPPAPVCSGAAWHDSVDNCFYSNSPQVRHSATLLLNNHVSHGEIAALIDMVSESGMCGSKELTRRLITPIVKQLTSKDEAEQVGAANFLLHVIADVISLRLQMLADRRNNLRLLYATNSVVLLWVASLLLVELLRLAERNEATQRLRHNKPKECILTPPLLLIAATIFVPRAPQRVPSAA